MSAVFTVAIIALVISASLVASGWLGDTADQVALLAAGILTTLAVAGNVFDAGLLGLQRSYLTSLFSFVSSVIALAATAIVAGMSLGLAAIIVATLAPVLAARLASAVTLRRIVGRSLTDLRAIRWPLVADIVVEGLPFAGISLASFATLQGGLVWYAGRFGPSNAAGVAVVLKSLPLIYSVVAVITLPLWPAIVDAAYHHDLQWVGREYRRATLLGMGYAVSVAAVLLLGGVSLYELWAVHEIVVPYDLVALAACLCVVEIWATIHATVLIGLGQVRNVAAVLVLRGAVSVFIVVSTGFLGQSAVLIGPVSSGILLSIWLLPVLAFVRLKELGRQTE